MQIHDLKPKTKRTISRRVGRGGKRGTTAGRGTKGQKARAGHRIRPEVRDMIKKLPKLRGRGIHPNKPVSQKAATVSLTVIDKNFSAGEQVSPKTLVEKRIVSRVSGKAPLVKIVATGEITKAVKISGCMVSAVAKTAIEKTGGSIE